MAEDSTLLATTTAIILAGGFGTRLRPVVSDRPKALASIGGRPFLDLLFERLDSAGLREVVVCTGYMAEQIENRYGPRYKRLNLKYSREESALGTAGALLQALPFCSHDSLLVLNGDSIVDVDLQDFYRFHRDAGAPASLTLVHVPDISRFGEVSFAQATCKIEEFHEKRGLPGAGWINAGVYFIVKQLLEEVPLKAPLSLEKDVFPGWVQAEKLYAFPVAEGKFIDIGTPESYREAGKVLSEV